MDFDKITASFATGARAKEIVVSSCVASNNKNVIWKQNIETEIEESNSIFNNVTECKMCK